MFTGLIECIGSVVRLDRHGSSAVLSFCAPSFFFEDLAVGDSIAVSGACLTVRALRPPTIEVDVSEETLKRTWIRLGGPGTEVNLERALRLQDRLGGHLVTGHVDGVGVIRGMSKDGGFCQLRVSCDAGVLGFLVEKGSVAVDGVSLTVVDVGAREFSASLVPVTLEKTTLGRVVSGTMVNIETDIIGKYVRKFAGPGGNVDARLADLLNS